MILIQSQLSYLYKLSGQGMILIEIGKIATHQVRYEHERLTLHTIESLIMLTHHQCLHFDSRTWSHRVFQYLCMTGCQLEQYCSCMQPVVCF